MKLRLKSLKSKPSIFLVPIIAALAFILPNSVFAADTTITFGIVKLTDHFTIVAPSLPAATTFNYSVSCGNSFNTTFSLANGASSTTFTPGATPPYDCTVTQLNVPGYNYTIDKISGISKDGSLNLTLIFNGVAAPTGASISKTFNPATNLVGSSSQLQIKVTDPVNSSFIDTLSSGLTIASPSNLFTDCTGSVSTSGNSIIASNLNLPSWVPAGGSCSIFVHVTSLIANTYSNTSANFSGTTNVNTSTIGGVKVEFGPVASGESKVVSTKSFTPDKISSGQNSMLDITFDNQGSSLIKVNFTDNLPAGVVVVDPLDYSSTCTSVDGYAVIPGGSTILVHGLGVPAASSCSISIAVTSSVVGVHTNGSSNVVTGTDYQSGDVTLTVLDSVVCSTFQLSYGKYVEGGFLDFYSGPNPISGVGSTPPAQPTATSFTLSTLPSGWTWDPVNFVLTTSTPQNMTDLFWWYGTSINKTNWYWHGSPLADELKLPITCLDTVELVSTKVATSNSAQVGVNLGYLINVKNIGTAPSSGDITIIDTLPVGLSYVSYSGSDWSCSQSGQSVTCIYTASIAPSSNSSDLTITVIPTVVGTYINIVSVGGGGDPDNQPSCTDKPSQESADQCTKSDPIDALSMEDPYTCGGPIHGVLNGSTLPATATVVLEQGGVNKYTFTANINSDGTYSIPVDYVDSSSAYYIVPGTYAIKFSAVDSKRNTAGGTYTTLITNQCSILVPDAPDSGINTLKLIRVL